MPLSWLLALTLQAAAAAEPTPYDVRRAEHERVRDPAVWRRFLAAPDTQARRLAARAVGRLEDPALGGLLAGALRDPVPAVRREAAWGIGQAKVAHDLASSYERERDPAVRAAMLEALGRIGDTARVASVLTVAVADTSETVAAGAARGLLALARRAREGAVPRLPVEARMAVQRRLDRARTASLRALLLRTDAASGLLGGVSGWTAPWRADASAEVRRLTVALEPWDVAWASSDPSPSVRYAALMTSASCAKAWAALRDTSPLLRSSAAAVLGALPEPCDAARLDSLARGAAEWQVRGEALVALARRAPERAGPAIAEAMRSPVRQLRTWAARAARFTNDSAALRSLARDPEPTVALEALVSRDDAIAALGRDHAGLVLAAATMLRGDRSLPDAVPTLLATLERLSRRPDALAWRDPRVAILARLREVRDPALAARVARWTDDADPAVAVAAARITGGDRAASAPGAPVPRRAHARPAAGGARAHRVEWRRHARTRAASRRRPRHGAHLRAAGAHAGVRGDDLPPDRPELRPAGREPRR
ncbi:MAG: hypothetical protein MUF21_12400 [Gemmatimonadaceae bacterium]|nr:hypothetical protein [Gemmatimonadaceae bacterium]